MLRFLGWNGEGVETRRTETIVVLVFQLAERLEIDLDVAAPAAEEAAAVEGRATLAAALLFPQ